jgi:hypothetical protein
VRSTSRAAALVERVRTAAAAFLNAYGYQRNAVQGGESMLFVLGIWALNTTGNGEMRPMLLLLLIVAVILLLMGCSIALLTLRNQRKDNLAFITVEKSDSDREKY